MDDHFRRRKQNEHAMRPPSDPRYHQPGQPSQSSQGPSQSQRHYHQQQPQQPPNPASADRQQRIPSGSGSGASTGYGGYYQGTGESTFSAGAAAAAAMGYPQHTTDYTQDARASFAGAYNPLYGVQQTTTPNPVFDTTAASFGGSRQHSGIPMMTADVASGQYFGGDSTGTGASAIAASTLHGHSSMYHPHQHQQQQQTSRSSYGGGMGALSSGGLSQSQPHSQPHSQSHSHSSHSQIPQASSSNPEPASSSAPSGNRDYAETNEAFSSYQRNLKDVFKHVRTGNLAPAAETLLGISDWLLTHVESLGLTQDDEDLYDSRIKLWNNFNNAWLALLEKQKQLMWSGQFASQPLNHRTQSVVSFEDLQKMARELVRLCDGVERFGLVDYDYGVWEERIMAVLTECVELYSMAEDEVAAAVSGPSSQA